MYIAGRVLASLLAERGGGMRALMSHIIKEQWLALRTQC